MAWQRASSRASTGAATAGNASIMPIEEAVIYARIMVGLYSHWSAVGGAPQRPTSMTTDSTRAQARAYRERGLELMQLGQLQAALTSLNEAVRLEPDDSVALNGMGVILLSVNQFPKALACFDRALLLQ